MGGRKVRFSHPRLAEARVSAFRMTLPGDGRTVNLAEMVVTSSGADVTAEAELERAHAAERAKQHARLLERLARRLALLPHRPVHHREALAQRVGDGVHLGGLVVVARHALLREVDPEPLPPRCPSLSFCCRIYIKYVCL